MNKPLDKHEDLGSEELLSWTIRQSLGPSPTPAEYAAWLKGEPRRRRTRPWLILALVGGTVGLGTAAFNSIDLLRDQGASMVAEAQLGPEEAEETRGRLGSIGGEATVLARELDAREAAAREDFEAARYKKAEAKLLKIHKLDPQRIQALELAADCALQRGDFQAAFARFRQAAEDPTRHDAAFYAAFGLAFGLTESAAPEAQRITEARRLLEPVWRRDWSHPARILDRALSAGELGEDSIRDSAMGDLWVWAKASSPSLLALVDSAYRGASETFRRDRPRYRDKPWRGRRRKAKKTEPPSSSWYAENLGEALRCGDARKARSYAEEWLEAHPESQAARIGLARAHRLAGEIPRALACYRRLDRSLTGLPEAAIAEYATLLIASGDEDGAYSRLNRWVQNKELRPGENGHTRALSHLLDAINPKAASSPRDRRAFLELFLNGTPADHSLRPFAAMKRHALSERSQGYALAREASGDDQAKLTRAMAAASALAANELEAYTDTLAWRLEVEAKPLGLRLLYAIALEGRGLTIDAYRAHRRVFEEADASRKGILEYAARRRALIAFERGLISQTWSSLANLRLEDSPLGRACRLMWRSQAKTDTAAQALELFLKTPGSEADFVPRAKVYLEALRATPKK